MALFVLLQVPVFLVAQVVMLQMEVMQLSTLHHVLLIIQLFQIVLFQVDKQEPMEVLEEVELLVI